MARHELSQTASLSTNRLTLVSISDVTRESQHGFLRRLHASNGHGIIPRASDDMDAYVISTYSAQKKTCLELEINLVVFL
jgi:hypothetical protein